MEYEADSNPPCLSEENLLPLNDENPIATNPEEANVFDKLKQLDDLLTSNSVQELSERRKTLGFHFEVELFNFPSDSPISKKHDDCTIGKIAACSASNMDEEVEIARDCVGIIEVSPQRSYSPTTMIGEMSLVIPDSPDNFKEADRELLMKRHHYLCQMNKKNLLRRSRSANFFKHLLHIRIRLILMGHISADSLFEGIPEDIRNILADLSEVLRLLGDNF